MTDFIKPEKAGIIAAGIALLCLGFAVGRWSNSTPAAPAGMLKEQATVAGSNPPIRPAAPAIPTTPKAAAEQQNASTRNPTPASGDASLIRLEAPEKTWQRLLVSPLHNYDTGAVEFSSLIHYGLSSEQTKALAVMINQTTARIRQLEVEHSKLITEPDGGQYFLIPPFPEEGADLQKNLNEDIATLTAALPDDRGKLLQYALASYRPFSNFGADKLEWAIQTSSSPDSPGRNTYIYKRYLKGGGSISEAMSTGLKSVDSRFQALVDRHLRFYLKK